MSRTYKRCSPTGYTGQYNKPWSMEGLKGWGYEYWSRRAGYAMPGKHKSGKKKTHTLERAEKRRIIYKLLEAV